MALIVSAQLPACSKLIDAWAAPGPECAEETAHPVPGQIVNVRGAGALSPGQAVARAWQNLA